VVGLHPKKLGLISRSRYGYEKKAGSELEAREIVIVLLR
jgi:hypothetical protein